MANTNFKPWLGSGTTTGEQTYYNALVESLKFESGNLIKAEDFNALLRMTTLVCAGIAGAWGFDSLSIDASEDSITNAIKNYELPTLKAATATIKNLTVPAKGNLNVVGTETVSGTLKFENQGDLDLSTLRKFTGNTIYAPGLYAVSVYSNVNTADSASVVVLLNAEEFAFAAGSVSSSVGAIKMIIGERETAPVIRQMCVSAFSNGTGNTMTLRARYLNPETNDFETFTPVAMAAYRIGPALPTGATPVPVLAGRYKWNLTLTSPTDDLSADITFTDLSNTSYMELYWTGIGTDIETLCYRDSSSEEEVEVYVHYAEPDFEDKWNGDAFKTINISSPQTVSEEFKTWFLNNAYLER